MPPRQPTARKGSQDSPQRRQAIPGADKPLQAILGKSSLLEATLLNRIIQDGLPAPHQQWRFCPTRRWRADFAYPAAMLLIEVDGGSWIGGRHTRGAGFEADCEKASTAAAMGWRVIRVTGRMIEDGRAVTLIRQALAPSDREES